MIGRRAALALAVLALAGCASIPGPTASGSGQFVEWESIVASGLPDQRVTIWLPPGYDDTRGQYPVLYMHDGHNLFDPAKSNFNKVWAADKAILQLVAEGRIEPHIIVGIWAPGEDRYRQYLPQFVADRATGALAASIREQTKGKPVISARYLAWLADELKPRIDAAFRTRTGPADTPIAGSSMGGLMSCYAIVERPDAFGRAACVSSHWPIALPEISDADRAHVVAIWQSWLARRLGAPRNRRIWMDHGTATLDAYYPPFQKAVDASFHAAGWRRGRDWQSREFAGAAHEENAWAARLPEILAWTLARR